MTECNYIICQHHADAKHMYYLVFCSNFHVCLFDFKQKQTKSHSRFTTTAVVSKIIVTYEAQRQGLVSLVQAGWFLELSACPFSSAGQLFLCHAVFCT